MALIALWLIISLFLSPLRALFPYLVLPIIAFAAFYFIFFFVFYGGF